MRPERGPENLVFFALVKEDFPNCVSPRIHKTWVGSLSTVIICFVPDFNEKYSIPSFIRTVVRNRC